MFSWARFYEGLFKLSATDKPDDNTIKDDAKLDRWFEQWQRDQARAMAKHGPQQSQPGPAATPQLIDLTDVFGKKDPNKGKDANVHDPNKHPDEGKS